MASSSRSPISHLTSGHCRASEHDHLTSLPAELLHVIFNFLFSRHYSDRTASEVQYLDHADCTSPSPCSHELDHLAATCKALRAEVNEWALHFLLQHQDITRYEQTKTASKRGKTLNMLRGRNGLLTWANKHCIFCGKTSVRHATLMNGFRCCSPCDYREWPDKITKTNARIMYDLNDQQLFPQQHSPPTRGIMERFPHGIPKIRHGTYILYKAPATMFLEKDVEWLARLYHGDLEAHIAKRKAAADKISKARLRKKADEITVDENDTGPL